MELAKGERLMAVFALGIVVRGAEDAARRRVAYAAHAGAPGGDARGLFGP